MRDETARSPARVLARSALEKAAPGLFDEPPLGHFWLEHLVRTLAERDDASTHPWEICGVEDGSGRIPALYAVNTDTGYAMLQAVDARAAAALLWWALHNKPPHKVLAPYFVLERAIEIAGLGDAVYRDHRELCLQLTLGSLAVAPDWHYRLARRDDIPRLVEYNRLYNEERKTNWTRDWERAVASRVVYVRERDGKISSCLVRGALLIPWVSLGGVFTFPEFRGLGEATMLVANCCAEMSLSGLNVLLIVDDDNEPALRAYSKVGFTPAGLFRTTYFDAPALGKRAPVRFPPRA